jgi:hypothetical protein
VSLKQLEFQPGSGIWADEIEGMDALQGNVTRQLHAAPVIRFLRPKGLG